MHFVFLPVKNKQLIILPVLIFIFFLISCDNFLDNTGTQLRPPSNFRIDGERLVWDTDRKADYDVIYIKRQGQDFERIAGRFRSGYSLGSLGLAKGINVVRVISGIWSDDFLYDDENFYTKASDPGEFSITVNSIITAPVPEPTNIRIEDNFLYWQSGGRDIQFSIKHPGQDYVPVNHNTDSVASIGIQSFLTTSSPSFIPPPLPPRIKLAVFGLEVGENIVKLVALPGGLAMLDNGILTNYTVSEPAYFTITVDNIIKQQLETPRNFRVSISGINIIDTETGIITWSPYAALTWVSDKMTENDRVYRWDSTDESFNFLGNNWRTHPLQEKEILVKVISDSVTKFDNGVLTLYEESEPICIKILWDGDKNISLTEYENGIL